MASNPQQSSKINVINSSAAPVPSADTVPKPTFATIPIPTQHGTTGNYVRVPIRRDLRAPNRIVAPRLDQGMANSVRSNMILNVQPRARVIGPASHTSLQYAALSGPVHVTQLRAGTGVRSTVSITPGTQILGPRSSTTATAPTLNLAVQPPMPKALDPPHVIPRIGEGSTGPRLQPITPTVNEAALQGERIIGDGFQARRGRDNEGAFEQPDADCNASWPKRQRMNPIAAPAANPIVKQEDQSNGHSRAPAPADQTPATAAGVGRGKPKASMQPPAAPPSVSNATDYSESESDDTPSQIGSSQSQSVAAASQSQTSFAANAAPNAMSNVAATQRAPARNDTAQRRACNCSRSHCLKLYCECFAHSQFCSNCNCVDCHNTVTFESDRSAAISATLERNPHAFQAKVGTIHGERRHTKGCNCKRSNCLKNYCECYEAKIACTARCKCVDCQNYRDSEAIDVQYRSARTRRLFNFDRAVQSSSMPGHFAVPERTNTRTRGASSSSLRSGFGVSSRFSTSERTTRRAPRNRDTGFDRNFEFGDEHDDANDGAASGAQPKQPAGAGVVKHPGGMRSRDLRILPSDLRVRSIVAREQARQRVLPHEMITDEIVEATGVCLITTAASQGASNEPAQNDATNSSESHIERSVLEEFGRCMQRLIAVAKRKQEAIRFGAALDGSAFDADLV